MSYDAMTAHTAVVFTRYMMLSVENRKEADVRTLGETFYFFANELSDITWIQAFHMIMKIFMNTISDKLSLTSGELDKLLNAFLSALSKHLKKSLLLCA